MQFVTQLDLPYLEVTDSPVTFSLTKIPRELPPWRLRLSWLMERTWWSRRGGFLGESARFVVGRVVILLGQWLNFKLFGITYLVGKIKFNFFFQGPLAEWVMWFQPHTKWAPSPAISRVTTPISRALTLVNPFIRPFIEELVEAHFCRIHVWYIYLHFVDFWGIHVGKYIIGGFYGNTPTFFWKEN